VNTSILLAPALRKTLAHSLTVDPVVKTSSISRMVLFLTVSGLVRENAPARFFRRAAPFKDV